MKISDKKFEVNCCISLYKLKAVFSASEGQYTAASGNG